MRVLTLYAVALAVTPICTIHPAMAKAGEWSGDDFLRYCVTANPNQAPDNADERDRIIYCRGYLEGAITTLIAVDDRTRFCLPHSGSPADIVMATVNWLNRHPDQKSKLLAGSIFSAVVESWPCN